jgi:hypothetical protein
VRRAPAINKRILSITDKHISRSNLDNPPLPLQSVYLSRIVRGYAFAVTAEWEERLMRMLALSSALVLTAGVAWAGDVESGLQPGDRAGAFNVKDCTGPKKGESLCYR